MHLLLPISQNSITDGLKRLAPRFRQLLKSRHENQLSESPFLDDATRYKVLQAPEGKVGYRRYPWMTRSQWVRYSRAAPGREPNAANR